MLQAPHASTFSPSLIPLQTPIEIGEVDRGRRKLRAQLERGFVFGLGLRHEAAPCIKGSERGSPLGTVRIELLGGDVFGGGAREPFTVGGRLARRGDRGEQRNGPEAHAPIGVGQQRRDQRPDLRSGALSSMSRAPIRTIGSGSPRPFRARAMFAADTSGASSVNALARANAGVALSDATEASSAPASGWSVHAA